LRQISDANTLPLNRPSPVPGLEHASTLADIEPIHADFSKLPLYNGDLEVKDGDVIRYPPEVEEFRSMVKSADAYLFALPEYNYSIPGMFWMLGFPLGAFFFTFLTSKSAANGVFVFQANRWLQFVFWLFL
jgi:hypothetical protein